MANYATELVINGVGSGAEDVMKNYFTDLHIHIGRTNDGSPVKITAARDLTLANILDECLNRKGITVIGIVDTGSPKVQEDIQGLIDNGNLTPMAEGGLSYLGQATLLLGSEVETSEPGGGNAHFVCYFPTLQRMRSFTTFLSGVMKNVNLSSQKARLTAQQLFNVVHELKGTLIPAHVFTPHKSVFGNCTDKLGKIFDAVALQHIYAVELGLSSDTFLADRLEDLRNFTFLTNSDAHSLPKIGREYNIIRMAEPNYQEIVSSLKREGGRGVVGNYGLNPRLGKYHRTHCLVCDKITTQVPPILKCDYCGSEKIVLGVLDRIEEIADYEENRTPEHRPPYNYQIPLGFIPGVGGKTIKKLLVEFGTEMEVLHFTSEADLSRVVGSKIAALICLARTGQAQLEVGGGGRYGKMKSEEV